MVFPQKWIKAGNSLFSLALAIFSVTKLLFIKLSSSFKSLSINILMFSNICSFLLFTWFFEERSSRFLFGVIDIFLLEWIKFLLLIIISRNEFLSNIVLIAAIQVTLYKRIYCDKTIGTVVPTYIYH